MKPRVAVLLVDILDSANAIKLHTNGTSTFAEFVNNRTVYRAVERELEIIAEAINKIKKEDKDFELMNAKQIIGLRNRIVHDYATTNHEIIWGVVVNHLDKLINDVSLMIKKYE